MKRVHPAFKASALIAVLTGLIAACAQLLPMLDTSLRVLCKVQRLAGDGGILLSVHHVYPDGATEAVDATIVNQE